jgi:DinB superfamily
MGQMTVEERNRVVSALERSGDALTRAIGGLTLEQWTFRPSEGTWSICECADHIFVIERLLFQTVRDVAGYPADLERAARLQGKDERLLAALADRGFKARNPFPTRPSGEADSPEQLARSFVALRASVLAYARATADSLRDHVARHPLLKDLDGVQWLLLIAAHTDRHIAQLEEVKLHPGYPHALTAGHS